jgi:hypothetical protein
MMKRARLSGSRPFAARHRVVKRALPRVLALLVTALLAAVPPAQAAIFNFVALGDLPYGFDATAGAQYRSLITAINRVNPRFSVHVGDFKAGYTQCSDEEFARQRRHFDLFEQAVIYTPGDNDWTDCGRMIAGNYDPLERLAKIRRDFFFPDRSLGQKPIALESQSVVMPDFSDYVENQRWVVSRTLFATLHIVGSNNRFDPKDPRAEAEFLARDRANIAWIQDAFRLAKSRGYVAVAFFLQADVLLEGNRHDNFPPSSGFRQSFGQTLLPLAKEFGKPVLIVHGDSHDFEVDSIYILDGQTLKNVTRLEVPGARVTKAVDVTVNEQAAEPFSFRLISTK